MDDNYLTAKQVAAKTGIPVRTLQNRIQAGTVRAKKVDPDSRTSAYLIPTEEVERLIAEAAVASAPVPHAGSVF